MNVLVCDLSVVAAAAVVVDFDFDFTQQNKGSSFSIASTSSNVCSMKSAVDRSLILPMSWLF